MSELQFALTSEGTSGQSGFTLSLNSVELKMPILGAHQSIAGGIYRACEIAQECGCDCVQIFTSSPSQWSIKRVSPTDRTSLQSDALLTKNNNQWRAKEITADEATRFKQALQLAGLSHPLSHDSYLINLAAPDDELWKKSIDAFIIELRRADQLGIPYVVTHPGSFTSSSEAVGLQRIVMALNEVHRQTPEVKAVTLLENTAGQGSNLGHRFEHLAAIIAGVQSPERVAVCIDTCHTFAAGYPISTEKDYKNTMKELDRIVGIKLVKAIHLNDSKRELGSRVDRHEHIGKGHIGLEGFRLLLNDPRFKKVPMYLETPKEEDGISKGIELDRMNLATLRSLVSSQ